MTAIDDVVAERARQDTKWGQQNHDDGTGAHSMPLYDPNRYLDDTMVAKEISDEMRRRTDKRFSGQEELAGTWADILLEEVFEALAEDKPLALRTELIQVAAVATQWAEAIDRREGGD